MAAIQKKIEPIKGDFIVSFGRHAEAYLDYYSQFSDRDLYYYLVNADEFPSVAVRAQQLLSQQLQQTESFSNEKYWWHEGLQLFPYTPQNFRERMQVLYGQRLTTPPKLASGLTQEQVQYLLKQYAPSGLLEGCWLQNISLAATNHTEVVTRLFRIYVEKIGDGDTRKHVGNMYRDLLRSARINLPEANKRMFTNRTDVDDMAFAGPVFELALSLFPRVFLPEIIGYTLGHYFDTPSVLGPLSHCPGTGADHLDQRYLQQQVSANQPSALALLVEEVVAIYLDGFTDELARQKHWQRIWKGLRTHHLITSNWHSELAKALANPKQISAHQKMLDLVSSKAPHARNMHRNRKMGGQLINDWFAQEPFDAEGFLKVLAASPYINVKQPSESALLGRSINFGGPMFRIFTDQEQQVIADWAVSLAAEVQPDPVPPMSSSAPAKPVIQRKPVDESRELETYAKCNKRELYYYFVNADLYPDILPTARKVALNYFRAAESELGKWNLAPQLKLFSYSYEAFQARIHQIYQSEIQAYEAFVPPSTVPREIMVWYTQQYAPFPMVDGSWVQHIARAGISHTEVSARLFRIYADEVGNSNTLYNHPNVYRKLLAGEGIKMPPTDSMDFVMQPGIQDFAFELPLLTLSVSMFPKAFLAEIIGVNLAIELSGLGKGYMQIIDELKFWKIDPYFFTLHLTIDNIASGHTAIAMETVHVYLDQILAEQGQQAMQQHWRRVWVGYLAFKQGMARFDSSLERQASLRFLMPIIKLTLARVKQKKSRQLAPG